MVCGRDTGHAEVILVEFDPSIVSYERLVEMFFEMHSASHWSPGSQYRSAIFTFGDEQRIVAKEVCERLRSKGEAIKTEITPAAKFWIAEEYHQQYYEKRGRVSACGTGRIS